MSWPVVAVLTLAAGMYPLGFMFGVCSECCDQDQCSNTTCDGFDLEEAYSRRTEGREVCAEWTISGNELTTYDFGDLSYGAGISKGQRVSGENIPDGTVVTAFDEIWDPPKEPYVVGDKRGCCRWEFRTISYDQYGNPVYGSWQTYIPIWNVGGFFETDPTEAECEEAYAAMATNPGVELRNYEWTECYGCDGVREGYCVHPRVISGGSPSGSVVGAKITLSAAPTGDVVCPVFGGQSGVCGPFPGSPVDADSGYGPYGGCLTADEFGEIPFQEYGGDIYTRRRMCVRWLCRCYESTGKRSLVDAETNEPLYPNPSDWYTIASTSEIIGGPTLNDRDLEADLDGATTTGYDLQEYSIQDFEMTSALGDFTLGPEGNKQCIVWAFAYYGRARDTIPCDCENMAISIKETAPNDDCFLIFPCTRCQ